MGRPVTEYPISILERRVEDAREALLTHHRAMQTHDMVRRQLERSLADAEANLQAARDHQGLSAEDDDGLQ